jgi:dihydrolipoamide dehydrogenase
MNSSRRVDVAVIGAGTAGLAAYRAAVAEGARALLVEAGVHGTTCARVGCMPSKLLIAAAEAAHHARHAGPFGVTCSVAVDGRAVMERVRAERDRFVGFVVRGVEAIPADDKMVGRARFVAPGVLDVDGERIDARAVVIATGSSPFVPAMFDVVRAHVAVNDDVFGWPGLPESIAVFGGGVVGIEIGQALHRLGVRVRIFGRGGAVGPLTDPAVKSAAIRALSDELPFHPDARVTNLGAGTDAGRVAIGFEDHAGERRVESFAHVLVATGRRPNVTGLGLFDANLVLDGRGVPVFDRATMQCGESPVFVAGDASDDAPLLHEAADEGRIAGRNAARFPSIVRGERRTRLAIAFSDPQIALVGSTFADLADRDDVVIGEVSFEDQGRSRVMRQNRGLCRLYAQRGTGRFLGAELAAPRAEHLGHLLAWAHQVGMTVDTMLTMPFYHPVVEEGLRTALRDASTKLGGSAGTTET